MAVDETQPDSDDTHKCSVVPESLVPLDFFLAIDLRVCVDSRSPRAEAKSVGE